MFDFFKTAHAGVISDAKPISSILLDSLNFLLQIFGVLAIISLVVSGIVYLISAGDQELARKGKAGIKYSIIGITVGLGGMIFIRTIANFMR